MIKRGNVAAVFGVRQPHREMRHLPIVGDSRLIVYSLKRRPQVQRQRRFRHTIRCQVQGESPLAELQRLRKENAELKQRIAALTSTKTSPEVKIVTDVPKDRTSTQIQWPTTNESPPFWTRWPKKNGKAVNENASNAEIVMAQQPDAKSVYIVHMTAEMAPIAKVGGLADVVTGLSRASFSRGHTVEVCLPYYECLPIDQIQDLEEETTFDCPKGENFDGQLRMGTLKTHVWKGKIAGVQVFLVRPDWSATNLFKGDRIYGGSYNELEAYLYFCRACLEFLKVTHRQPHVLHLHEWQTAAASMLYWERYHHDSLNLPRIMFTIHNMDNSGECRQDEFSVTGVHGEVFATVDKALDERTIGHNPERLCLMKGAMIYSNSITTVSPTYAKEVLNEGAAGWLRATLGRSEVRNKMHGILNGIDVNEWDPSTDVYLPSNFTSTAPEGKAICKEYLQKGLGLEVSSEKPLVSCITRLVPQKGIHLIKQGVYRTQQLGGQFVLLGTGHADGDFRTMAESEFKNSPEVKLLLLYSDSLAHLIYAASDIVLVPSLFEPCGLTQMIAMRYGALPVVRFTGGLTDTVNDLQDNPNGNGFGFTGVDENSLNECLGKAIQTYKQQPTLWREVSQKNMELDFSWDASVQSYIDLYNSIAAI